MCVVCGCLEAGTDSAQAAASDLPTVLACGAWLKNAAYRLSPGACQWSAVHGDLSDPQACRALDLAARTLLRESPQPVQAIAHDLHPDFYSTRLALTLADEWGVPAIGVQHHHAHIAAVMAEHGVAEPVVGLALDGVGLGTDGQAWGGELLWVAPHAWRRLGHLQTLAMPGGDVAAREPWRMVASVLHALGLTADIVPRFALTVGAPAARMVQQMLERGVHCPGTSSAGRWFDAAAGALGVSVRQSHEAQAAIALEVMAAAHRQAAGDPAVSHGLDINSVEQLDLRPLLAALLETPAAAVPAAALWFHLALADALADWAAMAAEHQEVTTVCLGGGCFANRLLTDRLTTGLRGRGLRVLLPTHNACGDAGLALGQAWVAAQQLSDKKIIATRACSKRARARFDLNVLPENRSFPCA